MSADPSGGEFASSGTGSVSPSPRFSASTPSAPSSSDDSVPPTQPPYEQSVPATLPPPDYNPIPLPSFPPVPPSPPEDHLFPVPPALNSPSPSQSLTPSPTPSPPRLSLSPSPRPLTHVSPTQTPPRSPSPLQQPSAQSATRAVQSAVSYPASSLPDPYPPLRTTSQAFNAALNPGLHPGRITQLCGPPLSGKTHIAHAVAMVALAASHPVVWLEAEHAVWEVHTRLRAAPSSSADHESSSSLAVFPTPTLSHLHTVLDALLDDVALLHAVPIDIIDVQRNSLHFLLRNVRLFVLHNPNAVLSPVLGLRLPPAWSGHVALERVTRALRTLAVRTGAAVLVTNRLVLDNPTMPRPALGNCWAALVDVSVTLARRASPTGGRVERGDYNDYEVQTQSHSPPVVDIEVHSKRDVARKCSVILVEDGIRDAPST